MKKIITLSLLTLMVGANIPTNVKARKLDSRLDHAYGRDWANPAPYFNQPTNYDIFGHGNPAAQFPAKRHSHEEMKDLIDRAIEQNSNKQSSLISKAGKVALYPFKKIGSAATESYEAIGELTQAVGHSLGAAKNVGLAGFEVARGALGTTVALSTVAIVCGIGFVQILANRSYETAKEAVQVLEHSLYATKNAAIAGLEVTKGTAALSAIIVSCVAIACGVDVALAWASESGVIFDNYAFGTFYNSVYATLEPIVAASPEFFASIPERFTNISDAVVALPRLIGA